MIHQALTLIRGLSSDDLDWLVQVGEIRRMEDGECLIREGQRPEAIWILLSGVFSLHLAPLGEVAVARLGPGDIVGEMSFLEEEPASATVLAVGDGQVMALGRKPLQARIDANRDFAARLYRAFAVLAHHRLQQRLALLADWQPRRDSPESAGQMAWHAIEQALQSFRALLARADAEALKNDGCVPEETAAEVRREFLRLGLVLNQEIGDRSPLPEALRSELGRRVQQEFLPHLLTAENAERYYSKPRGYAGDFFTIERMYENQPAGIGRLGPVVDSCFLEAPSARAVRNRRGLLCREILDEVARHPDRPTRVTSLACGPAREVFDAFERLDDKGRLIATLVDIDFEALAFVADRRDHTGLRKQVHLEQSNLVYLALGRRHLDLEPQDLVYSIGLTDYFEAPFVVKLLDFIHELLTPGGRVILGNFHPQSPVKAIMDHILDWRLIHRSEEEMNRIFEASSFGRPCARIQFEQERINLFAECARSPDPEAVR